MTDGAERRRFSGVGWLSSHLSRKLLLALVAAAVLSWGLMCGWFLSYLGDYAGNTYDGVMRAADGAAQRVGAFLEGWGFCGTGGLFGGRSALLHRARCGRDAPL